MDFGISSRIFTNEPLTVDVLERFRKVGFRRIEIFGNRPHLDFHDRARIRSLARWFDENEAPPPSIHLPFEEPYSRDRPIELPLFAPEERLRHRAVDELKRCMEFAEFTPVEYVVMHLGGAGLSFNPVVLEYAYAAIATVQRFSGVKVLLENGLNEASTPERLREFIKIAELQNVALCLDTGHAYLRNTPLEFESVHAIQLNDNDGTGDQHLWPFAGRFDWPRFVEKLTLAKFSGAYLFEIEGGDLGKRQETIERFGEMFYRANDSIEEFRQRYKIKTSRNPGTGEME